MTYIYINEIRQTLLNINMEWDMVYACWELGRLLLLNLQYVSTATRLRRSTTWYSVELIDLVVEPVSMMVCILNNC